MTKEYQETNEIDSSEHDNRNCSVKKKDDRQGEERERERGGEREREKEREKEREIEIYTKRLLKQTDKIQKQIHTSEKYNYESYATFDKILNLNDRLNSAQCN